MTAPRAPRIEKRRASDFERELVERARAWVPPWAADDEPDFARALLKIAARFSSEVAERLDASGDKMRRGFFDWLGMRGEAARPARMPVVFKTAVRAVDAVLARAPVRMQVEVQNAPVVFESETDIRVVPGRLDVVVGVDADEDAFFREPPGLTSIEPVAAAPETWRVKSFAAPGSNKLQLDPDSGLAPEMIVEIAGEQYRLTEANKDLVTIDAAVPAGAGFAVGTVVRKVTTFTPFKKGTLNRQEHALYLGDAELLNIEAEAKIEIVGAGGLDAQWQYWGKVDGEDEVGWQPLEPDPPTKAGVVALTKKKGAVEPKEIVKGQSSRWIRAFKKKVEPAEPLLRVEALQIRINCNPSPACPLSTPVDSPAAEGMANTTPLVLDNLFFPFGREPRQFDAFYLGSAEAFSKKGADVQLCFEMADPTFTALAAVRGGAFPNPMLVGVGQDRALHLFQLANGAISQFRAPVQPPRPRFGGAADPATIIPLDRRPHWRPPVWIDGDDFLVATSAGGDIWLWREDKDSPDNSGWIPLEPLPSGTNPVDGLVFLDGPPAHIAALRDEQLFVRDWPGAAPWRPVDTLDGGVSVALKAIVPVLVPNMAGQLVTSATEGMVGISNTDKLFGVSAAGSCDPLLAAFDFDPDISPVAVNVPGQFVVAGVTTSSPPRLVAFGMPGSVLADELLEAGTIVLGPLEAVRNAGQVHILAAVSVNGESRLLTWAPFATGAASAVLQTPILSGAGQLGGGPVSLPQHVVVPGARGDILVAGLNLAEQLSRAAAVKSGVLAPAAALTFQPNDVVAFDAGPPFEQRQIAEPGTPKQSGERFYPLDQPFPLGSSGPIYGFHSTGLALSGDRKAAAGTLQLDATDNTTTQGSLLLVDTAVHRVTAINPLMGANRKATLDPSPTVDGLASYWNAVPLNDRMTPYLRLDSSNNDWNAALLDRGVLVFPGADPEKQKGEAVIKSGTKPILVVLDADWVIRPNPDNPAEFIVDATVQAWQRFLGDTSTNPELSWEYWNGTSWSKLDVTADETLNLKNTGALRFEVPADMAPTDWSGKTNHWIRARLIGGDYGREKVTVFTSPANAQGVTEQTFERSTEGIRAPSVLGLHISYSICDEVKPAYVLTQDSGSIRDQSDANRTHGALVEAFVPLSVSLGRLFGDAAPQASAKDDCPPECDCPGHLASLAPSEASAEELNPPLPVTPATGRSLFLGFDARLSGDTVKVLLMAAEEKLHDDFAPLAVEALLGNRFVPLIVKDDTRALGESGVLTLSFPEAPTRAELFGRTLQWIRLAPDPRGTGEWSPSLRGAYLNALWASATETITRELLGSSEAAPHLKLKLARPPVLRDSLELRVRELLSDEDRKKLLDADPGSVLINDPALPGDWVLWEKVDDPGDEDANRRVYALDEETGAIIFGDGRHGTIPPAGRDSIVAFRYQRTEPPVPGAVDVPANGVEARTKLNLVTPVVGVEAVFAADHAAGGAPPEPDTRVLRFGSAKLRHRGRAVTVQDLEDLALASSPDIAQARAIVRGRRTRLVVVMRGNDPAPHKAHKRELKRLLLAAAPPSLDRDAFHIEAPKVRRLRVDLGLRVASLDHAGGVAETAKARLAAFFDAATGGTSMEGWPLGESPLEEDAALALMDVPLLLSLESIDLFEVGDESARAWVGPLAPNELVQLAPDSIRFRFVAEERAA